MTINIYGISSLCNKSRLGEAVHRRDFIKTSVGSAVFLLPHISCSGNKVPAYLSGYKKQYSKDPHEAALQWFKDAKFGLFVHYALASLLRRGKVDFIKRFEDYDDRQFTLQDPKVHELFDQFSAQQFDADFIADQAVSAGMKYITFTTRHLGRMYMFCTSVSDFTSVNAPANRDFVAEMARACEKRKLGLFLYVPPETARTDDVYIEQNHIILKELLTQYGPIAGMWFDGIGHYRRNPENYTRLSETFALVRSLQPQCLISFKEGAIGEEDFTSPEHFLIGRPTTWKDPLRQKQWQMRLERWQRLSLPLWEKVFQHKPAEINTVMQECWNRDGLGARGGWINDDEARHLTADEVMFLLKKARAANANLLLNIGPRGDGSVHPHDVKTLQEVGKRIRAAGFPGE